MGLDQWSSIILLESKNCKVDWNTRSEFFLMKARQGPSKSLKWKARAYDQLQERAQGSRSTGSPLPPRISLQKAQPKINSHDFQTGLQIGGGLRAHDCQVEEKNYLDQTKIHFGFSFNLQLVKLPLDDTKQQKICLLRNFLIFPRTSWSSFGN